jgi:transcriptional regulator with XRE-family HTH domain
MELGKRIEAAYTAKGFNQRQAALKLGWSAQRLANYVNGRAPDLASLLKIAREFDATPNELLGISGQSDTELPGILRRLLELEGLPAPRADTIAEVAIASLRQLQRLPGEHSAELPAVVAQTIWTERFESANDKSPRP